MNALKVYLRDLLGLIIVISSVLILIAVMLDVLAFFAYFSHRETLADTFIHESLPLFVLIIPSYFIGKWINRSDWLAEVKKYHVEAAKKWNKSLQ